MPTDFDIASLLVCLLRAPLSILLASTDRLYWLYLISALAVAMVVSLLRVSERSDWRTWLSQILQLHDWRHSSALADFRFFFVNHAVMALVFFPVLSGAATGVSWATERVFIEHGVPPLLGEPGPWHFIAFSLIVIVFTDLGLFISHYLLHKIPFLWEFHKVHHSAQVLIPVTVYRQHPVDEILAMVFGALCGGIAGGLFQAVSPTTLAEVKVFGLNLFLFLFYLFAYNLRHSNFWLDYGRILDHVFISPAQHQIHHSDAKKHIDKNFGFFFAFWDVLAGTLYVPKEREKLNFGLGIRKENQNYLTLKNMYFLPLKQAVLLCVKNPRVAAPSIAVFLVCFLGAGVYMSASAGNHVEHVELEKLTSTEVESLIKGGYRTVIVPTGGLEQNGAHLVLGKHNIIVSKTAVLIAREAGKTLVAPTVPYSPAGDINSPTEHMRFAGTVSLPPETFEEVLEAVARSLKKHGFSMICFLGDHGLSMSCQDAVAERLSREWRSQGVSVVNLSDYYNRNGQALSLFLSGTKIDEIGSHAGIRDTSELMFIDPGGVRRPILNDPARKGHPGVDGKAELSSEFLGKEFVDMKVKAAVRQLLRIRYAPQS